MDALELEQRPIPEAATSIAEMRERWDRSVYASTDYWDPHRTAYLVGEVFLPRLADRVDGLTPEELDAGEYVRQNVGLTREQRRSLAEGEKLFPGVREFAVIELRRRAPDAPIETLEFIADDFLTLVVGVVNVSHERWLAAKPSRSEARAVPSLFRPPQRWAPRRRGAGRPAGSRRRVATSSSSRGDPDLEPPDAPGPSTEGGGPSKVASLQVVATRARGCS